MRWERMVTVVGCHVGGEENDVIVAGVLTALGFLMTFPPFFELFAG